MALADTLENVLEIALQAGDKILEVYGSDDFDVQNKDDDSPLTRADLASHRHIVAALEKLPEALPILSEEAADIPYEKRSTWARYWLVDPLDGTKEFIKRNGEFTVNIALIDDGRPVLGVVHAPALATTYLAAESVGAFKIIDGKRTPMRTRTCAPVPALVVSRSHQDEKLAQFLSQVPRHEAVSRGSSLKFCLVAEGSADLYPRTGPTSEWDTAAGQCVAEVAGGKVLRLPDLQALRYNQKDSLLNPMFAVIGDTGHDWESLLASVS